MADDGVEACRFLEGLRDNRFGKPPLAPRHPEARLNPQHPTPPGDLGEGWLEKRFAFRFIQTAVRPFHSARIPRRSRMNPSHWIHSITVTPAGWQRTPSQDWRKRTAAAMRQA